MKKFQTAFSLVELLITLAIIAILCAVIYPSYQSHIIKTKRAQAKVALLDLANALEQYRLVHHSYQNATLAAVNRSETVANSDYRLQIKSASAQEYSIAAIPFGAQAKDSCGVLTYNHKGEKRINATGAGVDCW